MLRQLSCALRVVASLALSTGLAGAQTVWTVDDDGPADFDDIQPAINAAADGDWIFVEPGVYGVALLAGKGLSIIGRPGALIIEAAPVSLNVSGLSSTQRAFIVGLRGEAFRANDNEGPVVFEDLSRLSFGDELRLFAVRSSDVRCRGSVIDGGVLVDDSFCELVDCEITGLRGLDCSTSCNFPGEAGVEVEGGSTVFLARCDVLGGVGGDCVFTTTTCQGGAGGPAIKAIEGSTIHVSGDGSQLVRGGDGGMDTTGTGVDGPGAPALRLENSFARVSGVTLEGGALSGSVVVTLGMSFFEEPALRDPVLELASGPPAPGSTATLRIQGEVGGDVTVYLGRFPTLSFMPPIIGASLTDPLRVVPLGPLDGAGEADYVFAVPSNLPLGFSFVGQALVSYGPGDDRLANSVVFVLR